jgi:hypothetical protein
MTSPKVEMTTQAMKISFVLPILFLCSMASAQGKYRPGQYPVNQNPNDYTINFHVSATHFRRCASVGLNGLCGNGVYVDAILNGKKVELSGGVDKHQALLIVPGDYRAMLPKKPRASSTAVLFQPYYVLLPDKTVWPCEITGFSE